MTDLFKKANFKGQDPILVLAAPPAFSRFFRQLRRESLRARVRLDPPDYWRHYLILDSEVSMCRHRSASIALRLPTLNRDQFLRGGFRE